MNLLVPNLGSSSKLVYSALYDCQDPGVLTQDLLLVELPGKLYIDVSWFPEHDPSGWYTVSVFHGACTAGARRHKGPARGTPTRRGVGEDIFCAGRGSRKSFGIW